MQRILLYINSIILAALLFVPDASYAWKWNTSKDWKHGKDMECFHEKLGYYSFWFCGDQKQSCNGLVWAAGENRMTLKQGEVLTADKLKSQESDIDTSLGDKWICCNKDQGTNPSNFDGSVDDLWPVGTEMTEDNEGYGKGVFRENVDVTMVEKVKDDDGNDTDKNCNQKYNACGNKIGACEALCPEDGQVERVVSGNIKCVQRCPSGEVFENSTSHTCKVCDVTLHQGPMKADGEDGRAESETFKGQSIEFVYCGTCPQNQIYVPIDAENGKCVNKSDMHSFPQHALKTCWRCATSDVHMRHCLKELQTNANTADSWSRKCCDAENQSLSNGDSSCDIASGEGWTGW